AVLAFSSLVTRAHRVLFAFPTRRSSDLVSQFVGELEQYPPAHSAIKIDGERVYEKARRGEEVELKARRIMVKSFVIEKIEMPEVHLRIKCSKGTYIRSISHDI